MARDGRDNWLGQVLLVEILSNFVCGFIPVHEGHVAVHENEVVVAVLPSVTLHIVYHLLESLLAVECLVAD